MKLYEETKLDSENKKRLFNVYSCNTCSTEYSKQKRFAENSKYEHFCSIKCGTATDINNTTTQLCCANCGKNFTRLKSKLSAAKHAIYFCSRKCKDVGQTYIKEIQPDHYGTGESSYRNKALHNLPNVCAICSFNNIDALEVHHIDKNRDNNQLSNLMVLCANCHTLLHKNKLK